APGASSVRNATSGSQHFYSPAAKNATTTASNAGGRASGVNSNSRAGADPAGKSAGTNATSRSSTQPRASASGPATARTNQPSASRPATSTAQGPQAARGG